ncbi:MAG TPA: guanine nucleotide-binding protein subunit gamma [Chthoniobacteraceae bacterium]|nr:guanine nucleotide-binding protein subunit gamma [Chthoniobacteraceae bacterium]
MNFSRRDFAGLCALVVIVLLSRVPFLGAGYGAQYDAWRVANAARHIAQTGEYEASRLPGNPVQEYACSLLWKGGPRALNAASAVFGAAAVALLGLVARQLGCRDWLLAGLALAFTPVFYIGCVTSKDYTWALSLVLGALLACMKKRPVLAGILLGLATGCRLTSCAAGLPLLLVLLGDAPKKAWKQGVIFAGVSLCTAAAMFVPVFLKYGPGFFTFAHHLYPGWDVILQRGTVEVWGWTGLVGIGIALAGIAWRLARKERPDFSSELYHPAAWALAVAIYVGIYLKLPDLAGYLIPLLPFTILLLGRFSARLAFVAFCVLAMVGSFVTFDQGKVVAGAIFQDHLERIKTSEGIDNFLAFTDRVPGHNVFVTGAWYPEIENHYPDGNHGDSRYVYLLTGAEIEKCNESGETVYYATQAIRSFNFRVYGVDLAQHGALDMQAIFDQQKKAKDAALKAAGAN